MKKALQLFYFTLLTFCIIGGASAASYSIDWKAYGGSGWYALDLDPQSTYPIAEAYMRTTYDLKGGQGIFTYHFNGIESSWSFIFGGIEYSSVNPRWNPSSQTITPTMGTSSYSSIYGAWTSGLAGDPPQAEPVLTTSTGTESVFLPVNAPMLVVVPIPSAIWLLGSAFIGLVGLRRKFRKA